MIKAFSVRAWEDYQAWQMADRKKLRKLVDLIKEVVRTPYEGTGHPEALKGDLEGFWSRRIDHEHRLVYKMVMFEEEDALLIAQCRHHY